MVATYGVDTYAEATHGRISAELLAAQAASSRTTGLKVTAIKSNLNNWNYLAGEAFSTDLLGPDRATPTDQNWRGYRGQMGMCVLDNGTIVRVRIGDGSIVGNWNVYYQEITSPFTASQWTNWTLLYSGTHFAVSVVPASSSTYYVFTAKSDGVYRNNIKQQTITGVIEISSLISDTPASRANAMFVTKLRQDAHDNKAVMDHRYTRDVTLYTFADDVVNYRWARSEVQAIEDPVTGKVYRFQVAGFYINPRSTNLAESITVCTTPDYTDIEPETPPRIIRGFAGQAGSNSLRNPYIVYLSDGYYYLFYSEYRQDNDKTIAISVRETVFWQRSKDLVHWSEPVAIGYENMNPTGISVVELNGYVFLANNGAVYWRQMADTEYDLSSYIPKVQFEQPEDNEGGKVSFSVANPGGINDYLLDMADQEVKIEVGLRCADGVYRYAEFGRWWISSVDQELYRSVNRLKVTTYDLWGRLDNKLRDNYNHVGCVVWEDWKRGSKNELFNYYYKGGTVKRLNVNDYKIVYVKDPTSKFIFAYTGVKSHNGTVSVRFRHRPNGRRLGVIYRYKDLNNYYWCYSDGDDIYLVRKRDGVSTTLHTDTTNVNGPFTLRVEYKWGIHKVYLDDTLQFTENEAYSGTAPGYAGVRGTKGDFKFSNFKFEDWQPKVTTNDLVRTALAMGDFHDAAIAGGEQEQLAIVWGPQTDLNTPAAALQALCEEYELDLAWRNGQVEVGQFKDNTIYATYENEILEFSRTESIGKRINLASVDGREDSWIEIDGADSRTRGRQIVEYFDVPSLVNDDDVRLRAQEEVRKGVVGSKYECKMPLQFDLYRLDGVTITDSNGGSYNLRVEKIEVEVNQSTAPKQEMKLGLVPLQ